VIFFLSLVISVLGELANLALKNETLLAFFKGLMAW